MKIFTDTGNIDSLKLLAASNFKKVDFRIENVRLDGETLPVVKTSPPRASLISFFMYFRSG